jgi:hypothetical protein
MKRKEYPRIPENLINFDEISGKSGPPNHKLTIRERLFKYIVKGKSKSDCWEWVGTFDTFGRPFVGIRNHDYNVHRVIYAMYHPEFDPMDKIHNLCGNHKCVNPEHYDIERTKFNSFRDITKHPFYNDNNGIFLTIDKIRDIEDEIIKRIYSLKKKSKIITTRKRIRNKLNLHDICKMFDLSLSQIYEIMASYKHKNNKINITFDELIDRIYNTGKVYEEKIEKIQEYSNIEIDQKDLAEIFNLDSTYISKIINNKITKGKKRK